MKLLKKYLAHFSFKRKKDQGLGVISGVFIPNILQMVGVILFMRLSWILGHIGIWQMGAIITLASSLLLVTSFSITSIVTNMKIGGGGTYYIISRALGIEFGSAIGILLCVSQITSIALCSSGFALSLYGFLPQVPLKVLEFGTLVFLLLISYFSTNAAVKAQLVIFFIIGVSVGSVFLGSGQYIPDSIQPIASQPSLSFWLAFAMFFPATTGIEAGMSLSGDLKNPSRALPVGTIASVITAYFLYLSLAIFFSKNVSPEILRSHPVIIQYISKYGFLVILGIWGATLSSALGGILGAPRILQTVATDKVLPKFLSKGYGPTNQPRAATLIVFILATFLTLFTNINQLIPMLTMACLISYGLQNFLAFFEELVQNPSWRPSFRTPWVVSLAGSIGCFIAMLMINPGFSFLVTGIVILICTWSSRRKVKGNWDDLRYSLFSFLAHKAIEKLNSLGTNPKSWRPHILAVLNPEIPQDDFINFANDINQKRGFLTFCSSTSTSESSKSSLKDVEKVLKTRLNQQQGFFHPYSFNDPIYELHHIVKNYGLGPLKPNTILLSYNQISLQNSEIGKLLLETYHHNKNTIILKPLISRKEKKSIKQINLWWGGKEKGNFELSLALSRIMQTGIGWRKSKISLKVIVKDEKEKEIVFQKFLKYKEKIRINNLDFSPIIDPEGRFYLNLLKYSQDADITYLGMRRPTSLESSVEYSNYCRNIFEKTKEVNNIAFILTGEQMKFEKIFA